MQRRWFTRIMPALLVPGLCLALLTPAWAAAPQPSASRAYLGVAVAPTPKEADHAGALVRDVTPDSPASRAGLKNGDVIIRIGDREVKAPEAVVDAVRNHKAGERLALTVLRDGKEQAIEVTLGERRPERLPPMPEFFARKGGAFLGVWTQELTAERAKELGVTVEKGALVAEVMPESPAARAGLQKNDVITNVGDLAIGNPEELRAAVQKMEAGKEAVLKVARGSEMKEIKVTPQAGPLGFGALRGLEKDLPMLKDGRFPFEKLPAFDQDFERMFEELHKRIRELEQQKQKTDRSL